jgi:nitrogen-specific signal transduction histidine kinase
MKAKKTKIKINIKSKNSDFVGRFWKESWTYIKTVVDVVREPVLILDKNLCVLAANDPFYKTFQVEKKDTEKKNILPKNTFFKGFEVVHDFPLIGRKIMILNARQIHLKEDASRPIILLAIEDITEIMGVADMLTLHTNQFEGKMAERTEKLEVEIKKLEKEIKDLKK